MLCGACNQDGGAAAHCAGGAATFQDSVPAAKCPTTGTADWPPPLPALALHGCAGALPACHGCGSVPAFCGAGVHPPTAAAIPLLSPPLPASPLAALPTEVEPSAGEACAAFTSGCAVLWPLFWSQPPSLGRFSFGILSSCASLLRLRLLLLRRSRLRLRLLRRPSRSCSLRFFISEAPS